ncbi:hypothetical protein CYCD_06920 [Tenuifilaceae bacterium CYCD]|nr:hypothetical protein CYCD_06920 [Tenuifilaceae bacterium CYCD]
MELESAIQELLSRLEFVSLPGLGSFVKKYESATLSSDGKSFNPPREYFIFDTSRVFNDEAIENFICEIAGVDHKRSAKIVDKFVESLKERLSRGEDILFGGIGSLKLNEAGIVELFPSEDIISQTFGLGKLQVNQKPAEKKKAEPVVVATKVEPKTVAAPKKVPEMTTSKPRKRIVVPVIIAVAVVSVVAVALLVPAVRFWESEGGEEIEQVYQPNEEQGNTDDVIALAADTSVTSVDSSTFTSSAKSQVETKPVSTTTDIKSALYYQETKPSKNKTFYIIAGSFSMEANAQSLITELSSKGYKPLLIQNNNMYRVALYKFTNRDRALRELERLKSQNISGKVWLLSL